VCILINKTKIFFFPPVFCRDSNVKDLLIVFLCFNRVMI
jgi:hypothetical protein